MTPKELLEKRGRIVAGAQAKLAEITDQTDEARAAELTGEAETMIAEAEGLAKRADLAARADRLASAGDPRAPMGADLSARGVETPAAVDYRTAFHEAIRARDPHELSAEMRAALETGRPLLSGEQRAQIAGNDAAGGYLVPDEMLQGLVASMADWGPMYGDDFATVIETVGGGSMPIPGMDDTGNKAGKSGAEGAALVNDGSADFVFTKKTLEDYMIDSKWIKLSVQFLSGAYINAERFLNAQLGERLGRKANELLTIGTGAGEPLGVVTAAGTSKTAASISAITADELLEFFHSVNSAYRRSPKSRAMFNDNTLLTLHKLKDGQGNFLLQNAPDGSGVLKVGAMSIPYAINDDMANIGANAKSIVYGDFSRYYVRKVGGVVLGTARDSAFWPGAGIAGYARLDGALTDAKAIKAFAHPAT